MPHGWRLLARLDVSPRGCATDTRPAIRTAIAAAFVDRTTIDWSALLDRVRDPRERASLDALRRLDELRGRRGLAAPAPGRGLSILLLRLLAGLAALQTIGAVARAVATIGSGGSIGRFGPHLLIVAAFASASLLLASASARDRRVLLLVATFTFAATAFARAVSNGLGGGSAPSSVLFRGLFPEAFVPAALWQFAVLFPAVQRFTRFDVWARRSASAAWALAWILFVANLAIGHGWLPRGPWAIARDHPGNLFWHLFAAAALPAFAAIFIRAHRSPRSERDKAVRFGCALAAGAAPLLLTGLARLALPGVDRWMLSGAGPGRLAVDVVIVGALAAMPVLATLAVIVDRPFELRAIRPARLRAWRSRPGSRLGRRRRELLTASLDRVCRARGSREIAAILQRELPFGVGARSIAIVETGDLPPDSALLAILEESSAPIGLSRDSEPFVLLPPSDQAWLEARDVALIAPIRLRDGALAALAALGPRRGAGTYDRTDRWFLATLLTAAALAWERTDEGPGSMVALECGRCGTVAEAPPLPCGCAGAQTPALLPRRLADKFEVVRRLGAGGMGVVYLARDTALGRDVALKTLPALREESVARLRGEARAMAALNHEALATIYGLEIWRRTPVLVVEYMAGGTLAARLAREPLARADVVALGIRLAGALTYMHDRGLLHRDVKPGNIGITADGVTKLLDFGLSGDVGTPAGTPGYLPPETLHGAPPDTAVDLWGLATVLFQAGGGRFEDLTPFFARALAPSRDERFQSSAEIRTALLRLQSPTD